MLIKIQERSFEMGDPLSNTLYYVIIGISILALAVFFYFIRRKNKIKNARPYKFAGKITVTDPHPFTARENMEEEEGRRPNELWDLFVEQRKRTREKKIKKHGLRRTNSRIKT
jgi:LPXTG-motif cell wall-anchored protein